MAIPKRGRVDSAELERYRSMDCEDVLPKISDYVKADPSFNPIGNSHTRRWHLRAGGREFELLSTGPKFYDTRAKRGGGGAIDLVMHLRCLDFKQAVAWLREVL
ncbi:MAG: hypothetical protein NTX31_03305 [Burkholderiales bacterium]|nr:hypothetical protein [Burkholderiales bacterium]